MRGTSGWLACGWIRRLERGMIQADPHASRLPCMGRTSNSLTRRTGRMVPIPDEPSEATTHLARRLSAAEVEAVLRRAVELQVHEGDEHDDGHEGMPEGELVRIGHEIGLSPRHIQQALAETSAAPSPEEGRFGRGFGPSEIRVSRLLRLPSARAVDELDRYAREREGMVIHRRFPDRAVYARASGFAAELQRGLSGLSQKYPRLDVRELEIGVRAADDHSCYVAIRADLRAARTEWVSGGLAAGVSTGGVAGAILGLVVAPPAALLGAPILLASLWGFRLGYRRKIEEKRNQMESILDRLEHGELMPPTRPTLLDRLGL